MKLKILVESRSPKVGIFWYIDGELIDFTTDAREAQSVQGFKDSPYDHYNKWKEVRRAYKITKGDWADFPRGRVIYAQPRDRFEIISSRELISDESVILKIMRAFSLPRNKTVAVTDFHYEINPDLDAEFDD